MFYAASEERKKQSKTYQKSLKDKIILDDNLKYILDRCTWWIDKFGYIQTTFPKTHKNIKLHHIIIGKPGKGYVVDHANRNKLDNRKCNLRFVTPGFNIANRNKRKDSMQKFKGIQLLPSGKWRAKGYRGAHLGVFSSPEEAFLAFKEFNIKKFGGHLYAS